MEKRSPSLREKIEKLRRAFLERMPTTLAEARRLCAGITADPTSDAGLDDLYRIFHSIKGSAASFGFDAISATGGIGEALVTAFRHRCVGERLVSAQVMVAKMEAALAEAETAMRAASVDTPVETIASLFDMSEVSEDGAPSKRVFLCEDDALAAENLASQLGCFGYKVLTFPSPDAVRAAVLASPPDAVIMDIMFPGAADAGTDLIARINREIDVFPPVVFLSARSDFAARLRAVQAGGQAYFTKPVKVNELIDTLDVLTTRAEPEPFRVLVVDDEAEVGAYHSLILEEAGMTTRVLNQPDNILQVLNAFKPDLVLMDMYMPSCTGRDLSRLIRQIPDFLSLPIVFLSSETDKVKQVSALKVGAEGFLTKPIQPEDLISAVAIRAERMRTLRSLMVRDSLTGLFNHTFMSQFLESAVAGASREGRSLSVAMIDVDYFKKVNDSHGHPAGDQVLIALARLLQQRLRHSDMISRYGGEEFAVVMQNVGAFHAREIIDQLRDDFARVRFHSGERDFSCTFSGGVACFPDIQGPRLLDAADQALYAAKREGRNRIHLAGETRQ